MAVPGPAKSAKFFNLASYMVRVVNAISTHAIGGAKVNASALLLGIRHMHASTVVGCKVMWMLVCSYKIDILCLLLFQQEYE